VSTPALALGTYTARAEQLDAAGNLGLSSTRTFTITTYAAGVTADAPVGWWRLGEASGTSAANQVSGATAGTYSGGFTLGQPGALLSDTNTAVLLNGTTGQVSVAHYTNMNRNDGPLTLEAWIKRSRTGVSEAIMSKGTGAYELRITAANLLSLDKAGSGSDAVSSVAITDTNWHYVAATKNGGTIHLYLDGTDVTGTITHQGLSNNTSAFLIGADASTHFQGTIDEVAVYSTVLSTTRIQAHYSLGHS